MDRKSAYHVDIDRQLRQALPTSSTIKKNLIYSTVAQCLARRAADSVSLAQSRPKKKLMKQNRITKKNDGKTGFNRIFA